MKYIKTYEVKLGHFNDRLKQFIIIKNETGFYLYDIDIDNYGCNLLFYSKTYKKLDKNELKNNPCYFHKIDRILMFDDEILYQSDNLDDAMDQFELITLATKYNI